MKPDNAKPASYYETLELKTDIIKHISNSDDAHSRSWYTHTFDHTLVEFYIHAPYCTAAHAELYNTDNTAKSTNTTL